MLHFNENDTSMRRKNQCPCRKNFCLFLFVLFNQTLMLLAVLIIIDTNQQNLARVIQYRSWIILLPDLLQSSPGILIPFQFYNQCRIVIPVFRLRYEHEISKTSTCWQFPDGLEVILHWLKYAIVSTLLSEFSL